MGLKGGDLKPLPGIRLIRKNQKSKIRITLVVGTNAFNAMKVALNFTQYMCKPDSDADHDIPVLSSPARQVLDCCSSQTQCCSHEHQRGLQLFGSLGYSEGHKVVHTVDKRSGNAQHFFSESLPRFSRSSQQP